jgi:hypothetical protein
VIDPEAGLPPLHLGGSGDDLVREVLGRLPDNLDVPDHRVAGALVGDEGLVGHSLQEAPDLAAALDDVVGVKPPVSKASTARRK